MDTLKLNWTSLTHEVFEMLCIRAGEKLSQREIAKLLKVSPTAVANSLQELLKDNLVLVEKTKTINFISLNRTEQRAIELKRVSNLQMIYLSELFQYLSEELPGGTIILFGSYSRGDDISKSDIDIAIIERKDKILHLEKFEKILNRKININFYSSWKDIDKHLKNNILNGIVLHGSVEL